MLFHAASWVGLGRVSLAQCGTPVFLLHYTLKTFTEMLLRWCHGYGSPFSGVKCWCADSTRGADFCNLFFFLWTITAMDTGDPPGMFFSEYFSHVCRSQNNQITVAFLNVFLLLNCVLNLTSNCKGLTHYYYLYLWEYILLVSVTTHIIFSHHRHQLFTFRSSILFLMNIKMILPHSSWWSSWVSFLLLEIKCQQRSLVSVQSFQITLTNVFVC